LKNELIKIFYNFIMNSNSESADDYTKNNFFDSIKKFDSNKFTKCLYDLNSRVLDFTDNQNMNGILNPLIILNQLSKKI